MIHDNAYSELVYDGATCWFLSHPGAMEVGVEFNSLSKTYGMAGARVGFCVGNPEVVGNLRTLNPTWILAFSCPFRKQRLRPSPATRAVWQRMWRLRLCRRNYLVDELGKLAHQKADMDVRLG